ncbi:hypothetical protein GH742_12155 [Legionella sp. MW5194]|uniref:DUF5617 domain-containing protein n=1 Tax=Legionella sp. MW5194 TaxID=2662448 RepID=UPI00193D401A|nr:DUF5617 domain-containing protein [Legionella sp. MW5194]QRN04563.1 hypothetical protein GH742_12155 [Legionella sp. MW5194]
MPFPKESAQQINNTRNNWFDVPGNVADDYDDDKGAQPFWQFRVAIKPGRENAIKAAQALGALQQFNTNYHPECKIFIPDDNSRLETWDPTIRGGDRDQRGKEICVYMEYSKVAKRPQYYSDSGYPNQDYLKKLMLDIWQALDKAGVELAYVSPGPGEKEILVEDGTLTPFSYSSFKPYKGRHGLLNSNTYNPNEFLDPLEGVSFSAKDLKKQDITPLKAGCSAKRLCYQRQHYAEGLVEADKDLNAPFKEDKTYVSVVTDLKRLMVIKDDDDLVAEIEGLIKLMRDPDNASLFHEPFAAIGTPGQSIFTNAGEMLKRQPAQARSVLTSLISAIADEKKQAVDEMCKVLPSSSKVTREELEKQFDLNPKAFHRLYQRYAFLAQEKQTIAQEHQHLNQLIPQSYPTSYYELDKDDTLVAARNLLNDYTKSNSGLGRAFTFHWARHHTAEINQVVEDIDKGAIKDMDSLIDRLKSIELVNPKGSLSRRIDLIVCRHVDTQCQADFKEEEQQNLKVEL